MTVTWYRVTWQPPCFNASSYCHAAISFLGSGFYAVQVLESIDKVRRLCMCLSDGSTRILLTYENRVFVSFPGYSISKLQNICSEPIFIGKTF